MHCRRPVFFWYLRDNERVTLVSTRNEQTRAPESCVEAGHGDGRGLEPRRATRSNLPRWPVPTVSTFGRTT